MDLAVLSQWVLAVLGTCTVFLVGSKSPDVRRAGYLTGLLSEPFWLYSAIHSQQWGVTFMCLVYTVGWCRSLWINRRP